MRSVHIAMTEAPPDPGDIIFQTAGRQCWDRRGEPPRLRVLDAGTGKASLRWLLRAPWVKEWVAVTASTAMEKDCREVIAECDGGSPGRVMVASWDDASLLKDEQFDVIIADYLLGALDGFTPYKQDLLFGRLVPHLLPGGKLVIVGLEPIPNSAPPPGDVVALCARTRDAVFLHAGQRPYREYPMAWVLRALEKEGLKTTCTTRFPIVYSADNLVKELDTARSRLPAVERRAGHPFAAALGAHIDELETRTRDRCAQQPGGKIRFGHDYLVCAERPHVQ